MHVLSRVVERPSEEFTLKNTTLKAQLEALHDIGLDRVNAAIAATITYVEQVEDAYATAVFAPGVGPQAQIDDLTQQNTLLRAELAAVRNAIANPTPADAVPAAL